MAKKRVSDCAEGCPVESALGLIGGKWKGVILYHLMKEKTLRFGILKKNLPTITQRMLTKQLRELEDDNIISRKVYPEVPPKVEYTLTEFGLSLRDVIKALELWGKKNSEK
ncbi:MAG: helix-turn-helix transcriptional regulator [Bdellovibrionales bacterium]|nr:helix-turn-helix transcriptional regulator [Bdellovibrionales bacterium]